MKKDYKIYLQLETTWGQFLRISSNWIRLVDVSKPHEPEKMLESISAIQSMALSISGVEDAMKPIRQDYDANKGLSPDRMNVLARKASECQKAYHKMPKPFTPPEEVLEAVEAFDDMVNELSFDMTMNTQGDGI